MRGRTSVTVTASPSSSLVADPTAPARVDFWFDPGCPWAWITSRWMLEVTKVRPVEVRWHVMSLSQLNKDNDIPEQWREVQERGWGPVRIIEAARAAHGDDVVLALYTAFGERLHGVRGPKQPNVRETHLEALAEVGLPAELADAATDPAWDEAVIASHERGMTLVGNDVGTPIIRVDGQAVFGPIVTPIPRGEDAGRLWDGVRTVLSVDGFFELKRSRDRDPQVS